MRILLLAVGLVAACGAPVQSMVKDAGQPGGPDAGIPDAGMPDAGPVPVLPRFDADPLPPGAALFTKADLTDPKAPKLEIWAQGVGPVLGLAFHVAVDGAQLRIDAAGADPVMGLEARYLQKVRGADVAFGLARLGGETALMAPVRVAIVLLTPLGAVDGAVRVERAVARRADGTYVPLQVAGGKVVLP